MNGLRPYSIFWSIGALSSKSFLVGFFVGFLVGGAYAPFPALPAPISWTGVSRLPQNPSR